MPNYITADDANGNTQTYLLADFVAAFPAAPIRTPSANFAFNWNGVLSNYIAGQPAVVTADQFAAMTAAGQPIA